MKSQERYETQSKKVEQGDGGQVVKGRMWGLEKERVGGMGS